MISACDLFKDSTSSTGPTSGTTETFSGTLAQRGSSFYTFTVVQTGTVSVTLTSVGSSSTLVVGLGLGTPSGTNACTVTSSSPTASAGTTAQIAVTESPGTYCVQISDVGNLSATSTFSITIVHS